MTAGIVERVFSRGPVPRQVRRQLPVEFLAARPQEGSAMPLRDYFHSESPVYEHLCPEKRKARVTELFVGIGFGLFSGLVVLLAFLVRTVYDHLQFFRVLEE